MMHTLLLLAIALVVSGLAGAFLYGMTLSLAAWRAVR